MISKTLNTAVGFCRPNQGFEAKDVYTQSPRVAGAMALLCSIVDRKIIKMSGHWRSDKMLRYLHVQEEPLMRNFLWIMLTHGNYSFLRHQEEVYCF